MQYQEAAWANPLFDFSDIESGSFLHFAVPCAVCLAQSRVSQVKISRSLWNNSCSVFFTMADKIDRPSLE